MRTTITIPDELAQEAQALAGGRALSEFTREALRERVARLKRETVSKLRLLEKADRLASEELSKVERAIRIQLALEA